MKSVESLIRKLVRNLKAWWYRKKYRLKNASKLAYFCGPFKISRDVILEDYVYIGPHCEIYPNVTIKRYTMLANNVSVMGGDHKYDVVGVPIAFSGRDIIPPTIIGSDCWIGAHSIIKAGVHIADGCVIAMGSVVTKDTEPYGIYAGVPAKRVKERFNTVEEINEHIDKLSKITPCEAEKIVLKGQDRLIDVVV